VRNLFANEAIIAKYAEEYHKNDIIFIHGEPAEKIYFVHKGKVKGAIYTENSEKILDIYVQGDLVGGLDVFYLQSRSFTAIAVDNTTILIGLPFDRIGVLLKTNASLSYQLMQMTYSNLRKMMVHLEMAGVLDHKMRFLLLIEYLLKYGFYQKIDPTLEELSNMSNTPIERNIVILKELQAYDLVELLENGKVIVKLPEKLLGYIENYKRVISKK
jgi:CRP-like cAMP-binding protein